MTKISEATTIKPVLSDLMPFARPGDATACKATILEIALAMPTFSGQSGSTVVTGFASADAYFLEVNGRAARDGDMFVYQTGYVAQVFFRFEHPFAPGVSVWSYVVISGSYQSE